MSVTLSCISWCQTFRMPQTCTLLPFGVRQRVWCILTHRKIAKKPNQDKFFVTLCSTRTEHVEHKLLKLTIHHGYINQFGCYSSYCQNSVENETRDHLRSNLVVQTQRWRKFDVWYCHHKRCKIKTCSRMGTRWANHIQQNRAQSRLWRSLR